MAFVEMSYLHLDPERLESPRPADPEDDSLKKPSLVVSRIELRGDAPVSRAVRRFVRIEEEEIRASYASAPNP
jgi:hypothetical protein